MSPSKNVFLLRSSGAFRSGLMIKARLVLKVQEISFPMIPKTSTFCPIMPEENQVKDSNLLKKGEKT